MIPPRAHGRYLPRGFTLLELLVVVTLLAILAGLAVISVDLAGPREVAEQQARRLALLIAEQCEEAILDSRELGLRLEPDGYRFSILADDGWRLYQAPPAFIQQRLPAGFRLRLELEGAEVVLERDAAALEPHVLCYSSGELTPFQITVLTPDGAEGRRLRGHRDGSVALSGWLGDA